MQSMQRKNDTGMAKKESQIMKEIQMEATKHGCRLFRNQVGNYVLADGRRIQSGLCVGSADLIGWTKTGIFLSVEVKRPGGRISPEQLKWRDAVIDACGYACVCHSVEEFIEFISTVSH